VVLLGTTYTGGGSCFVTHAGVRLALFPRGAALRFVPQQWEPPDFDTQNGSPLLFHGGEGPVGAPKLCSCWEGGACVSSVWNDLTLSTSLCFFGKHSWGPFTSLRELQSH
jgi:hypothetical protein